MTTITTRRNISANSRRSGSPQHHISVWVDGRRHRIIYTDAWTVERLMNRVESVIHRAERAADGKRIDSCDSIYL